MGLYHGIDVINWLTNLENFDHDISPLFHRIRDRIDRWVAAVNNDAYFQCIDPHLFLVVKWKK